jgi:hypothetical protein
MKASTKAIALWHLFLAECCSMIGKDDAEIGHYRAALAAYQADGHSSKPVMTTSLALARLLVKCNDEQFKEGLTSLHTIEEQLKQQGSAPTANMARVHLLLGYAAERMHDYALAVNLYKRSHATFVAAYVLYSNDHIEALDLLARLYKRLGYPEKGEYYGRQAMALRRVYSSHRFQGPFR